MTEGTRVEAIATAVEWLARARHVCCLTGAGISAESGIPTFRGPDGFWAGKRAEDLATPEAFARNPTEVWKFYLWRRKLLLDKRPNAGHLALATIERLVERFTLITQNVDGLHDLGGSTNIIELHGSIWLDRCTQCAREHRRTVKDVSDDIPHCDACGAMMRPGVVWFGETLPPDAITAAQQATANCDVMLVVGTSALVQPAASLANWAKTNGAHLIEINPESTPLTSIADLVFPTPAGAVLPQVAEQLENAHNH